MQSAQTILRLPFSCFEDSAKEMFGRTAPPPPAPKKDAARNVDASLDEYRVHFKDEQFGQAQASREGGRLEARKISGGGLGTPSPTLPRSGHLTILSPKISIAFIHTYNRNKRPSCGCAQLLCTLASTGKTILL